MKTRRSFLQLLASFPFIGSTFRAKAFAADAPLSPNQQIAARIATDLRALPHAPHARPSTGHRVAEDMVCRDGKRVCFNHERGCVIFESFQTEELAEEAVVFMRRAIASRINAAMFVGLCATT